MKVQFYEKNISKIFAQKPKFLKKKTIFSVQKGEINSEKILKKIEDINPNLIILNATSLIKKLINLYKNKIINVHAGLIPTTEVQVVMFGLYNKELEYTGMTVHFVNERIDDGKIIKNNLILK